MEANQDACKTKNATSIRLTKGSVQVRGYGIEEDQEEQDYNQDMHQEQTLTNLTTGKCHRWSGLLRAISRIHSWANMPQQLKKSMGTKNTNTFRIEKKWNWRCMSLNSIYFRMKSVSSFFQFTDLIVSFAKYAKWPNALSQYGCSWPELLAIVAGHPGCPVAVQEELHINRLAKFWAQRAEKWHLMFSFFCRMLGGGGGWGIATLEKNIQNRWE